MDKHCIKDSFSIRRWDIFYPNGLETKQGIDHIYKYFYIYKKMYWLLTNEERHAVGVLRNGDTAKLLLTSVPIHLFI